jgi:hypothetical protein
MRKLWRWVRCLTGWHDNLKAREWGMAPLFPIVCDNCGALYYHDHKTGGRDAE